MFNFANPNDTKVSLPTTSDFLPSVDELAGGNVNTFIPSLGTVTVGVPPQEQGVRPARALPYELNVHATVNASASSLALTFLNTGWATVVFQVRSGNPSDLVRNVHSRTPQAALGHMERFFILRSVCLWPQRVRALLQGQRRVRRRVSRRFIRIRQSQLWFDLFENH